MIVVKFPIFAGVHTSYFHVRCQVGLDAPAFAGPIESAVKLVWDLVDPGRVELERWNMDCLQNKKVASGNLLHDS